MSNTQNSQGASGMRMDNFPFQDIIMFLLKCFTIPVAVLLRRDFGERWLTPVNYFIGFLVLSGYSFGQQVGGSLQRTFSQPSFFEPNSAPIEEPSFLSSFMSNTMAWILWAYLILGVYHFFKMWWRNSTFTPFHSHSEGVSRLLPIGGHAMNLSNRLAAPIINLLMMTLPKEERDKAKEAPPLMVDSIAFTDTIFEPFFLFFLSIFLSLFGMLIVSFWLFSSCIGLAIFAYFREQQRMNDWLNMRDASIDAQIMQENLHYQEEMKTALSSNQKMVVEQIRNITEKTPGVATTIEKNYPDLMAIIEEVAGSKMTGTINAAEQPKPATIPLKQKNYSVEEKNIATPEPLFSPPIIPIQPEQPKASTTQSAPGLMDIIDDMAGSKTPKLMDVSEQQKPINVPQEQSEFVIEETIVSRPEPSPQPSPVPMVTEQPTQPKFFINNSDGLVQNSTTPLTNWVSKNAKLLLVAGVGIISLFILYLVLTPLLRKTETSATSNPNETETSITSQTEETQAPEVEPLEEIETPSPPLPSNTSTKFLSGIIQTEKGSNVNMRDLPTVDAEPIMKVPSGAKVIIFRYGEETELNGEKGRWCRIGYNGEAGWIWGKYVKEK